MQKATYNNYKQYEKFLYNQEKDSILKILQQYEIDYAMLYRYMVLLQLYSFKTIMRNMMKQKMSL